MPLSSVPSSSKNPTSASGGPGLFTTQAVSAGDLLLCENVFAHVFADNTTSLTVLINTVTDTRRTSRTPQSHHPQTPPQPSLSKAVTSLHHGTYNPVNIDSIGRKPIVD